MAAQSLYARVAARGFPVFDLGGQSGQGTLPDSTQPGNSGPGEPSGTWTAPNVDTGSVATGLAAPAEFISGGLWGLSGAMNPDLTPRTHAAPFADPTLPVGLYYEEADAAHAFTLGGPEERRNVGTVKQFRLEHLTASGGSASDQQPITGPMRALAGYDAVQGYGGGGDGPGGVNGTMPLTVDQRSYPGELYRAFVDAAEVDMVVPEAAQFIPNEPSMFPWRGGLFNSPTSTVRAQDPVTADVPAQGPAVGTGLPAYATSFWG